MGVAKPGFAVFSSIAALSGVAGRVPRIPAVSITSERRGIAQAITTAAIMPREIKRSRNHVRRNCQIANLKTAGFRERFPDRLRGCVAPGIQKLFSCFFMLHRVKPTPYCCPCEQYKQQKR